MLALSLVEEVDRLVQEGRLSQRKIAARLGVSRGTVGAIASGRRGLHGKDLTAETSEITVLAMPPERCPRCGFKVTMPCLVCRTREHRTNLRLRRELAAILGRPAPRIVRRRRKQRSGGPRRSRVA